ncbi:hypothetical protein FJT64_011620 [Amphibalanus amphitrite]|uniref:Uncharacterized protein n=1 Tax=Amphibalanus amphitrite TaxID=1232801 RepID=A0A6A4VAN3_AMPAM|nr:hypothetical protein FJT64_011620 [Amphibalanus amphitrite]
MVLMDAIRFNTKSCFEQEWRVFGIAIVVVIVVVVIVGVVGLVAALSTGLTSSGRGLDTDEWEVDHSVWMNQLQKDFEDSWSTE